MFDLNFKFIKEFLINFVSLGNLEIGNGYGVPGGGAYGASNPKSTLSGKNVFVFQL